MRLRPVARPLVVAVTAILGSGCQVFQPYVIPRHYSEAPPRGSFCNAPPTEASTLDKQKYTELGTEVAFARSVQRQLSCFARHHAEFAAAMGYTLIPLAALVSYKGFAEAGPHNIAALAAGGAAGYGIARYQYKPRDIAYLGGVTAIDCAVQVAQPSILTPTQTKNIEDRRTALSRAGAALGQAAIAMHAATNSLDEMKRLAQALDTSTAKMVRTFTTSLEKRAQSMRDELADLRSRATTANNKAITLIEYNVIARKDLVNTVEGIVNAVNAQIATQQPDPAVLASLVGPLKMPAAQAASSAADSDTGDDAADTSKRADDLMRTLKAGAESRAWKDAAAATTTTDRDRLRLIQLVTKADADLDTAERELQTARDIIESAEAHFAALSTPTNLARLHKQCSIDVQAKAPLTISLPTGGITVASGGAAASIPVVGGTKPYSATIVDTTEKGTLTADLKVGVGDAYTLVLAAKDFSEAKTVRVIVQDALGQAVEISVQVKPK